MFFEDFTPGFEITTPRRTVTGEDLDTFLDIADLHLPMFLDDSSAQELGHPRRLVTGPMILAVAMGLVRATGCFDQVVAGLEFNAMRFRNPVHPGDALEVHITVQETRPTRQSDRGLIILAFEVSNQDNTAVLEMNGTYLFRRNGAGGA